MWFYLTTIRLGDLSVCSLIFVFGSIVRNKGFDIHMIYETVSKCFLTYPVLPVMIEIIYFNLTQHNIVKAKADS